MTRNFRKEIKSVCGWNISKIYYTIDEATGNILIDLYEIEKEAIRNETIAEKMLNKINISAKELGIDPSKVDGYKELSEIPSRVSQLKRLMDTARTIVKEMSKRI